MRVPDAASRSAIGLLRGLLAASLLVPALLFAGASWINYHAAMRDALTDLLRTSEVAREQAAKVFDGQSQVADRVTDLVRGMDAAAIRRAEKPLHDAFAQIVSRLPQVQSVLLASRDGHPLVSAGVYPVPVSVDLNHRDYFRAVVDGYKGTYVSSLQVGDINRRPFFGLARPWLAADDSLAGVIDVAVAPTFFRDFYQVLVGEGSDGAEGKVVTLVRDDGQILVRYPPFPGPPPRAAPDSPLFKAIAASPDAGTYDSHSIIDGHAPRRLFAYRRVVGYPIYVVAGQTRAVIIGRWQSMMASHLLFGVPSTLALFALTWTALVRARREEQALARARREMARREAAEATLLQTQRLEAVGQMTGGVAHDFNNLLTVILGCSEMLQSRADDPARVRQLAGQLVLAAKRGGEVTQQLLAFSRRQFVSAVVIDLNRRLQEFRALLERAASEAVSVELDLGHGIDPVRLDPGHFEAAMLNLVGNARDAMPQGGRIVIATRRRNLPAAQSELPPGGYVGVTVTDTGIGMDPATAAKAFEPFFTTKEIGRGTGLGLSQVYGFAKQAGGDVRIVTDIGRGTSVELLLPLAPGCFALDPAAAEPAVPAQAQGGEVVLVVEDEPHVLDTATAHLRELGYTTVSATTAQAALDWLRAAGRVDVLFSDVVMPGGMSGVQLSHAARRLRPELRILLTSGYTGATDEAPPAGIALLAKPYHRADLAASLRAVLTA